VPFGASPTSLAASSLSTYFRVQDRPWWRVALVAPTATPVRAARGWRWGQGGRPGEHALCLDALSRACQTTPATPTPMVHAWVAAALGGETSQLGVCSPPRPVTCPRAASPWRPVLARPLVSSDALWCQPHQPRSPILTHLLSLAGSNLVASRPRPPAALAAPSPPPPARRRDRARARVAPVQPNRIPPHPAR